MAANESQSTGTPGAWRQSDGQGPFDHRSDGDGALSPQAGWNDGELNPYPPPEVLAAYAAIETGLLARILDRIDAETTHRRSLEQVLVSRTEDRTDRSQTMAFIVALGGTVGALVAGYLGVSSAVCITVLVFCIGGPNAATILARILDRRQG